MLKKIPLTLCLTLGLLTLSGCDRQESSDVTPSAPPKPTEQVPVLQAPTVVAPVDIEETRENVPESDAGTESVAPPQIIETIKVIETVEAIRPAAIIDGWVVEKFIFQFHKETKAEVCGDWDYFKYNGSMSIRGRIQTQSPIDPTAEDFELDLTTPFESYILPARRERETIYGQEREEQVIARKRNGSVWYVKNYRVDDDETVYRNDDDETGVLKNYGPLIDAMIDWKNQTFLISITRAELTAEDIESGEVFDFSLTIPRYFSENEDFDQATEFRYTGDPIDSENYEYDGDCP